MLACALGLVTNTRAAPPAETSGVVRALGVDIHYVTAGRPDAPPLVLVHGLVSSVRDWARVIPGLAADDYVIAFDRPGAGQSGSSSSYSLPQQAAVLARLLDALAVERAVCVGHAYGGSVCLTFAVIYPGRVSSLILVGSNGIPFPIPAAWKAVRSVGESFDAVAEALFNHPAIGRPLVRNRYVLAAAPGERVPDALIEGEYEDLRRNGLHPLFREIRQWDDAPIAEQLHRIAAPTLVLCGGRDTYYMAPRRISYELSRRIQSARLVEVAPWGNMPQVNDPDGFVARVREFLRETASTVAQPLQPEPGARGHAPPEGDFR